MSKWRNKWIWSAAIVIAMLLVAVFYKTKTRPKGIEVTIEQVFKRTLTETVSASGKIYPEKEIKISSDVSGEITELFVEEGDSVTMGQILARINPDVYESAVERTTAGVNVARSQAKATMVNIKAAQAQRDQIRSQLQNANNILERSKKLYQQGVISKAELETAETNSQNLESNLRSAEANVEAMIRQSEGSGYGVKDAEAMLKEQKTNLGRTILKAPVSGIVSQLSVERGERVVGTVQMSGTEMMRIADLSVMEVQIEVSENDIVRIEKGNQADIEVDAWKNKNFTGYVTEISNSATNLGAVQLTNDQVAKFIVKVRIDSSSYRDLLKEKGSSPFKPGMSATVEIKTFTVENALSVPIQSVRAFNPDEENQKTEKKISEVDTKGIPNDPSQQTIELNKSKYLEAVFVKSGDTVIRKQVTTGIQDQNYIEIKQGLMEKEEVISGPYSAISRDLKNGSRIRLKKE
ncbi:MAG: efflux RND transporter periplasmic adaptor subunit [Saprospiraceae bacterium]|nr:efflux RND transporter periplasmic adaptor subunit [Saprospiraceae bacterium]